MNQIPEFLNDRLVNQYGEELANEIIAGYQVKRKTTLRINTIKSTKEKVITELKKYGVEFTTVNYYDDALIVNNINEDVISKLSSYEKGEIYLQNLSSMIPPLALNPQDDSHILDMAAAPGSKTTQLAALTHNKACITACELNPLRAEKLKYNLQKQGCSRVTVLVNDARRLDDYFRFEKILLDAPCSGSGTLSLDDPKVFVYFTEKLIKTSQKRQVELLKKGFNALKPGGVMVYSTCSILFEENEYVVQSVLKGKNYEIIPYMIEDSNLKKLPSKIEGALVVMPNEFYEGFFVCVIRKTK